MLTRIYLKFAELHTPLFLMGTNFGNKLEISKRDIQLVYDREMQELYVIYKGSVALIPSSNIVSLTPTDPKEIGIDLASPLSTHAPVAPVTKVTKAQVSDPVRDLVFGKGN